MAADLADDERLGSPPLSQRIPIARLELSHKNGAPVNDELDAYSKALLVEFSWSDLSPPPPPNQITTYTLEWDEKPIVLPLLEEQKWEWDAPIEVPQEIIYDGTKSDHTKIANAEDEDTVMLIALVPGTVPHISRVYLRQKRNVAIAPPILEEEIPAPLEIPVKTLPQTYPLSSEFLGANYRYIADLILRDVETSTTKRKSSRGILHTVFAARKIEDIEAKLKSDGEKPYSRKHLLEEKQWLEDEFKITLDRVAPPQSRFHHHHNNAPEISSTTSDIGGSGGFSSGPGVNMDTPTSPTATAKEWTSQATLATTTLGHRYDDPPVPWPTSPNPKYPAGAYSPNVRAATIPFTAAAAAAAGVKPILPPGGVGMAAGLGLVGGMAGLNLGDGRVSKEDDEEDDDDDNLFQVPIAARSTF